MTRSRWTSVQDKLPKDDEEVLITHVELCTDDSRDVFVNIGRWMGDRWVSLVSCGWPLPVTHWARMPNTPDVTQSEMQSAQDFVDGYRDERRRMAREEALKESRIRGEQRARMHAEKHRDTIRDMNTRHLSIKSIATELRITQRAVKYALG